MELLNREMYLEVQRGNGDMDNDNAIGSDLGLTAYSRPVVKRLGRLDELTQGGSFGGNDAFGGATSTGSVPSGSA